MQERLQQLTEVYTVLRDQAGSPEWWTTDYLAYWNIVESFKKENPREALLGRMTYAREALASNDRIPWSRRDGYRAHYARQIVLTEQAIACYDAASADDLDTRVDFRLLVAVQAGVALSQIRLESSLDQLGLGGSDSSGCPHWLQLLDSVEAIFRVGLTTQKPCKTLQLNSVRDFRDTLRVFGALLEEVL